MDSVNREKARSCGAGPFGFGEVLPGILKRTVRASGFFAGRFSKLSPEPAMWTHSLPPISLILAWKSGLPSLSTSSETSRRFTWSRSTAFRHVS